MTDIEQKYSALCKDYDKLNAEVSFLREDSKLMYSQHIKLLQENIALKIKVATLESLLESLCESVEKVQSLIKKEIETRKSLS